MKLYGFGPTRSLRAQCALNSRSGGSPGTPEFIRRTSDCQPKLRLRERSFSRWQRSGGTEGPPLSWLGIRTEPQASRHVSRNQAAACSCSRCT
jgi:hypothetical protein